MLDLDIPFLGGVLRALQREVGFDARDEPTEPGTEFSDGVLLGVPEATAVQFLDRLGTLQILSG